METRSEVKREELAEKLTEARFRSTAMRPLREALSDESYAGLLGVTDSETIFAGMLDLLRGDPQDLAGAAERTIRHVSGVCGELGVRATLNLALADGARMPSPATPRRVRGTPCTSPRVTRPSGKASWPPPGASAAAQNGGKPRTVICSRWRRGAPLSGDSGGAPGYPRSPARRGT